MAWSEKLARKNAKYRSAYEKAENRLNAAREAIFAHARSVSENYWNLPMSESFKIAPNDMILVYYDAMAKIDAAEDEAIKAGKAWREGGRFHFY